MCGIEIPAERTFYSISFNEEQESGDGRIGAIDKVKLLICCTRCGDSENIYYIFKRVRQEAGVLK